VTAFSPEGEAYMMACVDLIRRTGSTVFQLRYSDDEEPMVWMAVATYPSALAMPNTSGLGKQLRIKHKAECASALDPILAVHRLCEQLIDGGQCVHCKRATMMEENWSNPVNDVFKYLDREFCWRVYDPELKTFTIGCQV
jgi:hypothetical protein